MLAFNIHGQKEYCDCAAFSNEYGFTECECASFFTDCTHEVAEVTEGWRVVAQFDIYEEDQTQEEIEEQIEKEMWRHSNLYLDGLTS